MSEDKSGELLASFVLLAAIPTQIAAMVAFDSRGILDWVVLGALLTWGWLHIDAGRDQLKRNRDKSR